MATSCAHCLLVGEHANHPRVPLNTGFADEIKLFQAEVALVQLVVWESDILYMTGV